MAYPIIGEDQSLEFGDESAKALGNFGNSVVADQDGLQSLHKREVFNFDDGVVTQINSVEVVFWIDGKEYKGLVR